RVRRTCDDDADAGRASWRASRRDQRFPASRRAAEPAWCHLLLLSSPPMRAVELGASARIRRGFPAVRKLRAGGRG
ncbi:unnamed protein product, partial [Musa acuminata subsp. burmannicoides]